VFRLLSKRNWCSSFFFGKRTDVFFFKEPMFKFLLEKELVFMFFLGNRTGVQVSFERNWRSSSFWKKTGDQVLLVKKIVFRFLWEKVYL
jgi:hypothetical protein